MVIAEVLNSLDEEIGRLKQAKTLLLGEGVGTSIGNANVTAKSRKKRVMSAEARARISAAQKKRWAKQKKS